MIHHYEVHGPTPKTSSHRTCGDWNRIYQVEQYLDFNQTAQSVAITAIESPYSLKTLHEVGGIVSHGTTNFVLNFEFTVNSVKRIRKPVKCVPSLHLPAGQHTLLNIQCLVVYPMDGHAKVIAEKRNERVGNVRTLPFSHTFVSRMVEVAERALNTSWADISAFHGREKRAFESLGSCNSQTTRTRRKQCCICYQDYIVRSFHFWFVIKFRTLSKCKLLTNEILLFHFPKCWVFTELKGRPGLLICSIPFHELKLTDYYYSILQYGTEYCSHDWLGQSKEAKGG